MLEAGDVALRSRSAVLDFACPQGDYAFYTIFVPSFFYGNTVPSVSDGALMPHELTVSGTGKRCTDIVAGVSVAATHVRHALPCSSFGQAQVSVVSNTPFGVSFNSTDFCEATEPQALSKYPWLGAYNYVRIGYWAGFGVNLSSVYVFAPLLIYLLAAKCSKPNSTPLSWQWVRAAVVIFLASTFVVECARDILMYDDNMLMEAQSRTLYRSMLTVSTSRLVLYTNAVLTLRLIEANNVLLAAVMLSVLTLGGLLVGFAGGVLPAAALVAYVRFRGNELKRVLPSHDLCIWAIFVVVTSLLMLISHQLPASTLQPRCNDVVLQPNQRTDKINVPACVSSLYIAAVFFRWDLDRLLPLNWLPTMLYGVALAIVSFGYWWTQCTSWHRPDKHLTAFMPVVVVDALCQNKCLTFILGVVWAVCLAGIEGTGTSVDMYEMVLYATGPVAIAILCVGWKRPELDFNYYNAFVSLACLGGAAFSLWLPSSNRHLTRSFFQPTAFGHFLAGVSLYVASLKKKPL
jgi:hypothetical protein